MKPAGVLSEADLDRYRKACEAGSEDLMAKLYMRIEGVVLSSGQLPSYEEFRACFKSAHVRLVPSRAKDWL